MELRSLAKLGHVEVFGFHNDDSKPDGFQDFSYFALLVHCLTYAYAKVGNKTTPTAKKTSKTAPNPWSPLDGQQGLFQAIPKIEEDLR